MLLLVVQPPQGAVVLLGDASRLEHVVLQLLPRLRRVHHQHRHQEHPLIPGLQVLQKRLGLRAIGGEIRGDDVHIVSASDGLFLLLNGHFLQIGDLPLHIFNGRALVNGLDMERDHHAAFQVQEVRQHPVGQLRGQDLQEGHCPVGPADLEHPAILEGEAVRGDEVLAGKAGLADRVPGEPEFLVVRWVEHLMEDGQPLIAIEGVRPHPQGLEVSQHVRLDTLQPGLGLLQTVRLHAEGDVLGLGQAVVALGELAFQHIRVFFTDAVKGVPLIGDMDGLALFLHIGGLVEEGELDPDGAVKVVEKIAPVLKDQVLILVLRQLVVNVVELDLLGEEPLRHHADTVPAHLPVGDGLLGSAGDFAVPLGLLDGSGQPPLLAAGELGVRGQADGVPQVGLIFFVLSFCRLQIFCLLFLLFLQ